MLICTVTNIHAIECANQGTMSAFPGELGCNYISLAIIRCIFLKDVLPMLYHIKLPSRAEDVQLDQYVSFTPSYSVQLQAHILQIFGL